MYIKGMVQVLGVTYRITRVEAGSYRITRIADEAFAGSFLCGETLVVEPSGLDAKLLRIIAAAAVHGGKTSWMGPAVKSS